MKKILIITIIVLTLISISLYYTYAIDISITPTTGTADLTFNVDINNIDPKTVTVEAGKTKAFDILLKNTSGGTFRYGIAYSGTKPDTVVIAQYSNSKDLVTGTSNNNTTKQISIVIKNRSNTNYTYTIQPVVGFVNGGNLILPSGYTLITETTSISKNPNPPKLVDGLFPVTYDSTNSTWVKADPNNTNYSWYDYDSQKWANAVLIREAAYTENISETNKSVSINNASTNIKKYRSSNQGVKSTSSISTFTFTTGSSTGTLSFDYTVSSEPSYDKLTIKLDDTTLVNAISGIKNNTYSGSLSANTTYTITATYSKDSSQDKNDDEATISNIQISNLSGNITVGSSGDYPWTEEYIYSLNSYSAYTLKDDGKYYLESINNYSAANSVGRYICSDTTSSECTTMYKITGYSGNTINKVDVYTVGSTPVRSNYVSAAVGTTVLEEDVMAYYVWVPRYKYKVFNINKVLNTDSYNAKTKGIDIVFESGTASTGTVSCTSYSYASPAEDVLNETCTGSNGDYYTHPAFTFGNDELTGIWFGKFDLSSENPSLSGGGGNSDTLTPRIKPGVTIWVSNPITNYWKVVYDMQKSGNMYGLTTDRTKADSHLMKNMEWGAMTYLSNSKYGFCSSGTCVRITHNTTGKAGGNNYKTNVNQSTTGNIYGIYDTAGGEWNFVMGNISGGYSGYTYYAQSGGSNFTYSASTDKYIDKYGRGTSEYDQTAQNRTRLGDATGEVAKWNDNENRMGTSSRSWQIRGDYSGNTKGGIFTYSADYGSAWGAFTSGAVLVSLQ